LANGKTYNFFKLLTTVVLDFILGADHSAVYKRAELRELMNYHVKGGEDGGDLNVDEVNVIKGALLLSEKKIANIITPIEDVFMLSVDDVLNQETIEKLLSYGHSRVPVYQESRKNIIGLILVKRLLNINTALSTPVKDIKMSEVVYVEAKASIWSVLTLFQSGKSHMAVVKSEQSEDDVMEEVNNIGIVTLEDIFEELIQKDIEDETDLIVKPQRKTLTEVLRKVTEPLRNKFKSPSAPNQIEIEMDTVLMNDIGTTLRSDTAGGHL
jgi:CBS domain containing-hemolysin-like protein